MQNHHGHSLGLRLQAVDHRELDGLRQGNLAPSLLHPLQSPVILGRRADTGIRERKIQRRLLQFRDGLCGHQANDRLKVLIQQDDSLLNHGSVLGNESLVDAQGPSADIAHLAITSGHLDGGLPQGITDEEVSLGVAELMMAMARIGRVLRLADEITGRHEHDVILEFRAFGDGGLGVSQSRPLLRCVDPGTRQLADDHGKLRRTELLADIANQVHQILLILGDSGLRIHAVVPTLIPDEASQLDRGTVIGRKILLQVRQSRTDFGDHLKIIWADHSAGAGRAEIAVEALTSPSGLDEQDLIAVDLADDMAKLELRPEMVLTAIHGVADRQSTG